MRFINKLRFYIQFAIAVLFCLCLAGMTRADEAATSPNFVIFYVDDLGWADEFSRAVLSTNLE